MARQERGIAPAVGPMENPVVSIMAQVDVEEIARLMAEMQKKQMAIAALLQEGRDYGRIPGRNTKPVLLKPGAEKILMGFGLRSEFEIIEAVRDYENGFFAFTVKCKIYSGDTLITEGLGHANTKESNRKNQSPYDLANTVLKIAKKRALVDAALMVAGLSDIFTQDLDDFAENHEQAAAPKTGDEVITSRQLKRLWAIAHGDKELLSAVLQKYGYKRLQDIRKVDYNGIVAEVEDLVAQKDGVDKKGEK